MNGLRPFLICDCATRGCPFGGGGTMALGRGGGCFVFRAVISFNNDFV